MPDIYFDNAYQGSGSPTVAFDQFYNPYGYQNTSQACLTDLTPPTFAGIAAAAVQSRGEIRASWLAGSDLSTPVRYEIYIQATTATGLFNVANIVAITDKLLFDIFKMPDGTYLQNGTTYFIGVRAVDAVGNREGNTVSLSVISTGVMVFADTYQAFGAFAVNASNQLQGTLWVTKNSVLSSSVVLGVASYQVYDKTGALVSGLSEINLTADSNGQYIITPVSAASLTQTLDHYMVKVTIKADGVDRSDYVPLIQKSPDYDISGLFFVNNANRFDGTFWVSADEKIKTTGLGTGAYQVFDSSGTLVAGMSQSGITADANGVFKLTDIASILEDDFAGYSVRVTLTVDSVVRSEMFAVQGKIPEYEVKGVFSINASNQFRVTMWAVENGLVELDGLGTASYTVYDADGSAVPGLTESGLTADGNGRFKSTPVSAASITDLTHYTVKLAITVHGIERVSYRGFSLLGN